LRGPNLLFFPERTSSQVDQTTSRKSQNRTKSETQSRTKSETQNRTKSEIQSRTKSCHLESFLVHQSNQRPQITKLWKQNEFFFEYLKSAFDQLCLIIINSGNFDVCIQTIYNLVKKLLVCKPRHKNYFYLKFDFLGTLLRQQQFFNRSFQLSRTYNLKYKIRTFFKQLS
jgi:hypothetical protein